MLRAAILLTLLASCALFANAACSGAGYDLSSLAGKQYTGADQSFNYFLTICGICNQSTECTTAGASMCAYIPPNYYTLNLLKWTDAATPQPTWTASADGQGVSIAFNNADERYSRVPATTVNIKCGTGDGTMNVNMDSTNYVWVVDIKDSSVCGGPNGGISGGWIFIILATTVPAVYIAAGCALNMKREGTGFGMDSCPNKDMWCGFVGLITAGCAFTKSKIMGGSGDSGSNYDDMDRASS